LSTVESSARGRDANTAHLYERIAEGDHEHAEQPDSPHVMRRGTSHDAAQLVRGIIAARDDRATHRPPGRRKHRPRGGSPRPGTQPLRPPRPRRSIQANGLPALARGNPGTGGRAAARDRPTHPGVLGAEQLAGALVAAELVQMPLLDVLAKDLRAAVADPDSDSWAELNMLSRAEVSQATGMLVA